MKNIEKGRILRIRIYTEVFQKTLKIADNLYFRVVLNSEPSFFKHSYQTEKNRTQKFAHEHHLPTLKSAQDKPANHTMH